MPLKFHYSLGSEMVLTDPGVGPLIADMKAAGVETVWLHGYFFGKLKDSPEDMAKAKKRLEAHGFEVNAISVPVGHPGNSLNPGSEQEYDVRIPETWKYRVDSGGNPVYHCACIDEQMLKDNKNAVSAIKDAGFREIFYDDDLRMGNFGARIEGCFCDECLETFNGRYGFNLKRDQLKHMVLNPSENKEVCGFWMDYNCEKVTNFLREVTLPGIRSGIMVMHYGDRRHGIDIEAIKRAVPGCFFRVGEGNFSAAAFNKPEGRQSLIDSVKTHMALVGDTGKCYSETTVFPANAMPPEMWVEKMRVEVKLGLKNLFLMSGLWVFPREYWAALATALPELRELEERVSA